MRIFENLERIKKMNGMIKSGHTGTPAEFASSMGISQSHLFRCLKELQHFGLNIQYSRSLQTYFYGNDNELVVHYSVKIIDAGDAKEINGGVRRFKPYQTGPNMIFVPGSHLLDHLADDLPEFFNIRLR